jgi:hypothetical protein
MSKLANLIGKNTVEKSLELIDKVVPDTEKRTELKFEIYRIIVSNQIARWVRAIIALMFFVTWLYFPENLKGKGNETEYIIWAILGYYYLVDKTLNRVKQK